MEAIQIKFEEIEKLLPKTTDLYYVDYNSSLDEHADIIQKCIDNKSPDALHEEIDEWYEESPFYAFKYLDKELVSDICKEFNIEEDEAEEIIEEHGDNIRDHYYNVDQSSPLEDLIRNSRNINVRVELYSNHDCMNSFWLESQDGYEYKETYFGHVIDVLSLNPAKVKKLFIENDIKCNGKFPNYKHRDGKEYISYDGFLNELLNTTCGANLLTFVATINIQALLDNNFELKEVTIPKGNSCGFFSSTYGGGSIFGIKLQRDLTIKLDVPRKKGLTKYDNFGLLIDETNGYSIDEVYGVSRDFFGNEIIVNS